MPPLRTIIGWAIVIGVALFVITSPAQAAGVVSDVAYACRDGVSAVVTFFRNLF